MALSHVKKEGYLILDQNAHFHWGEIDIIAKDKNEIVFIEVKTRRAGGAYTPEEGMTTSKMAHLMKSVHFYLLKNHLEHMPWRVDLIAIEISVDSPDKKLRWYKNIGMC